MDRFALIKLTDVISKKMVDVKIMTPGTTIELFPDKIIIHGDVTDHFLAVLNSYIRQGKSQDIAIMLAVKSYYPEGSAMECAVMETLLCLAYELVPGKSAPRTHEEDVLFDNTIKEEIHKLDLK